MLDWLDPPWIRNPWYPAWILLNYYPWQPSTTSVFLRIFTFPKKEPVRRLWYMKANEDHGCQSRTFDDLRRSNSPDGEHLVFREAVKNRAEKSKSLIRWKRRKGGKAERRKKAEKADLVMQFAFWQTCQNAIKCHEMTQCLHFGSGSCIRIFF